jgi:hypothetical protein
VAHGRVASRRLTGRGIQGLFVTIVRCRALLTPGSYLTISHIGAEFFPDEAAMVSPKW